MHVYAYEYTTVMVIVCVPEIREANIRRMPSGSLMLAIKGAPADHDTQTCCLDLMLNNAWICNF